MASSKQYSHSPMDSDELMVWRREWPAGPRHTPREIVQAATMIPALF
jgi:hypothetical protein